MAGFRNAIIDYWSLCQVEFWEGEKKRWRLPRRKLCLFVDSACLLASASHMNIFPNVTRPQLRAKKPTLWRRVNQTQAPPSTAGCAAPAAFYTHAYALLWLVRSSCHVCCLFAQCCCPSLPLTNFARPRIFMHNWHNFDMYSFFPLVKEFLV